jgi:ribonuclease D
LTSPQIASPDYRYVATNSELEEAAADWSTNTCVALDTEFMRVNTFYPVAALFQIGTRENCYLIDPLTITDFKPLVELLESRLIVKIMHACSEDLEVFKSFLKCQPKAIYDTQIGAAFLGAGLSIGYKNLVDEIFQVDLPKGEQRSDWLQRPLSDRQLCYAALDVTFLTDIYQQQLVILQDKGWLEPVEQEIQVMLDKQLRDTPPTEAYRRVKGANRLSFQQLQTAYVLAQWREIEARSRNIPRGFLFKDSQLLEMAEKQPDNHRTLARIEGMRHRFVREDGDTVLALIAQASNSEPLVPAFPETLPPRAKPLIKELQLLLVDIAKSAGLIPELLLNRKTLVSLLTELVNTGEVALPLELPAWKKALFGEQLLAGLTSMKGKI